MFITSRDYQRAQPLLKFSMVVSVQPEVEYLFCAVPVMHAILLKEDHKESLIFKVTEELLAVRACYLKMQR